MGKGKNVAYVRVSTAEQNESRQREALQAYDIDRWFVEKASGKDIKRPELQAMLDYIREDDTVYVEEFSRLGRSTSDLLSIVQGLRAQVQSLLASRKILTRKHRLESCR